MRLSLAEALQDAASEAVPFSGVCFRNVSQQFASRQDILSARGSFFAGGRFNFRGAFELLYLSCDIHTCLEETTKALQQDGFTVAKALPRTIIGVEVGLRCVLDLTNATVRRRLGLTVAGLVHTGWQTAQDVQDQEAPTQRLGRLARDAGFEGLLVPSAATRKGRNLDVYPDRLRPGSFCRALNAGRLPPV